VAAAAGAADVAGAAGCAVGALVLARPRIFPPKLAARGIAVVGAA
jgi:hypothetical protein